LKEGEMLETIRFKDAIQKAVAESGNRFHSISKAQEGSGWQRCRVDYQKTSGRHERVFIYLIEKSTDDSVRDDVLRAVRYQDDLYGVMEAGMAESA